MAKSFDELAKRTMTPAMIKQGKLRARAYMREIERKQIIATLKAIRKASGMGQKDLANALGIKQPTVARMETQGDIKLSTLIAFAKAAGGEVELTVRMPRELVRMGAGKAGFGNN